ncbi:hypothetical protein POM88_039515 [Heracleum sosnowskyi]|uniref:RNA helicase n=1 Tax=Heracleum sosnowskyi TaxID=360622 RepID=A0AAD8HBC3_9APIA|nr:hypothetical protein POM88_039515 [Heracleum sosnowskyi]
MESESIDKDRHHRSVFRPRIRPPLFQIVLTGEFLAMLPLDPKLGKMLIMGAIFRCFDPILTIVAGLSVRDPFLLPQDKKDLAGTAKARYSAKDYSDHMALVRAFEGWKDAEREGSAYEYCWRNYHSILV